MSTGISVATGIPVTSLVTIGRRQITAANTGDEVSIQRSEAGSLDDTQTLSVEGGGTGSNSADNASSLEIGASSKVVETSNNASSWPSGKVDLSGSIKLGLSLSSEDTSLELSIELGSALSGKDGSSGTSECSSAFTCKNH
eukprot:TRINITY_DN144_c0_g1_i7.p3 TRINITY_DN144_c0_g1~~TRINITY_DN144_c0_g1_i7.p3  ORF type:complete len:141 (+),score=36.84 TRINITY_DN144_c0_g1_i7:132-554(+)